jgi:hypothetical protein
MSASISHPDDDAITLSAVRDASRSSGAIVSEGVLAGMIAAAAVAAVFLVFDLASGQAFQTPRQLGAMLLSAIGSSAPASESATPIAMYTLFHFVAFIGAGILAASIAHLAMKQPVALLLFVILFFAFEVAFTGFVAFLDATSTGGITPMQVAIGNIVASITMAIFFSVRHPSLRTIGRRLAAEE